jgi:exodeoxyribonuclease-5
MVTRWGLNVECVTCAKLLGLRPVINRETGREEFKKNYAEDSVIQDYDIVVVDEASMVAEDLFGYLSEEANILTKILFVGDWAQLPPVGESISRAFLDITTQSALTEVKRYSGAIAVVADDLRRNLSRRGEPLISTDHNPEKTQGTFVLTEEDWKEKLIRAFKSERSAQDPNYCRALAWRNRTVNSLNQYIREEIQGQHAPRFVIGERLLANEHYGIKDAIGKPKTLFAASAEMEVLSIFEGSCGEWSAWFLDVVMLDSEGAQFTIPVLHEDDLPRFEAEQAKLKRAALKGDKHLWDRYFENRKAFAWVDYAYAMTVHKSQGSTFNNVFADMGDIMGNTSKAHVVIPGGDKQLIYERNQLLYVALTRASDRVFIFE